MLTYLVRARASQELIGIFAVPRFDVLLELVARCAEVADCEYAPVRAVPGAFRDLLFSPFPVGAAGAPANDP